ncbi:MAG: GNAT family N-acetyltransferase [Paludibacteraceae bacterium]|nr:GNAT family N-acetyltransferase [Paludibacteraceae bacterium]
MEDIIEPINPNLLVEELTKDKLLRKTNKCNNEIYVVTQHDSPNVMKEIGRLREISFRTAGGGVGLACDIDEYDTMERPYHQLIVWNPDEKEIIGGYRYLHGSEASFFEDGSPKLTSSHLFAYSEKFIKEFLPYTIELGRSFVRPEYQSSRMGAKSLYALDNLWDGLGALMISIPRTKYFFGKATIYPSFGEEARSFIMYFMHKYFPDNDKLVFPKKPIRFEDNIDELKKIFCGGNYKEDYSILKKQIKQLGHNIPPLINAYMSLSPTMRTFGSCINDEFNDVLETGLMITIEEIFEEKRIRHVQTYLEEKLSKDSMGVGYGKIC